MNQLTIRVEIPVAIAIAAGKTRYGEVDYSPSEADLASLTPEERCDLCIYTSQQCLKLASATVEWPAIARSLRAERDARIAKLEKSVDDILAKYTDPEEWVSDDGEAIGKSWWNDAERNHPRVQARMREIAPLARNIAVERYCANMRLCSEKVDGIYVSETRLPDVTRFAEDSRVQARLAELRVQAHANIARVQARLAELRVRLLAHIAAAREEHERKVSAEAEHEVVEDDE